ncbi:malonyl-[acyl-carrier protein] O-methyltransferase-like [Clytia hemisphaerica]|uniref:malonyl-[acyl-carrier protein] O-methyltransferase-like n=1 Tax=Clytia hemisphaerica TaxID=252671 RepID=UPI0034D40567
MAAVTQQAENFSSVAWSYFIDVREDTSEEFAKQQELYSKYAKTYDEWASEEEYSGPKAVATKILKLYSNEKNIKILDYGCGTGATSDLLSEHGYQNIDGLDPCKEIIDVARSKGKMQKFYQLKSGDDDSVIPSQEYDVVCSSGVLFCSASHPGYECLTDIIRYVKPGGHIIIAHRHVDSCIESRHVTDLAFLDNDVKQGKIKVEAKEVIDRWRRPANTLEGEDIIKGELLIIQVL